ncbi:hypothetical protein Nepgr_002693 [Nepenthes gracilis]|uniref:Uncharacterized protein n=1 Tax=Nepenthes gracilis TaxID=150966 RepID=A0AAD3P6S4_NEPGR|nr:hypothetical protein Nepgr_002693 [Nepenthes gracilis]
MTLATSRQSSSLTALHSLLEGPDIASNKDMKKIGSFLIPTPPVSSSNSFAILLEVDSVINKTKKMASGNDGSHNIDLGSKRNTAVRLLPEAETPCVVNLATNEKLNAAHFGAAFSSATLVGDEVYELKPENLRIQLPNI